MRLIDADALIGAIRQDVDQAQDSNWGYGLNHAIPIVRSQPTFDAVQVVRCKDCKYYPNGDGSTKWLPCMEIITPPGWYCADGERKEGR